MYKVEDYPLVVPDKLTPELIQRLKIGRDYRDLFRLGLKGSVKHTKATDKMPELWWDFNEQTGEWTPYGIQIDIDRYQTAAIEGAVEPSDIPTKVSQLENDLNYQTESEVDEKIADAGADLDAKITKNAQDIESLNSKVDSNKESTDASISDHEVRLVAVESKATRNTNDITSEIQNRKDADDDLYAAIRSQGDSIPTKVSQLENDLLFQTESEVDARIQEVVGAAPEALDTLEEIARELEEGSSVVAGIINTLATKADKSDVDERFTNLNNKVDTKVSELSTEIDANTHSIQSVASDLSAQVSKEASDIEEVTNLIGTTKSGLESKIEEVREISRQADEAISAEVELKADKAEVDSELESINSELALKAVKSVVDEQIESLHDELTRVSTESSAADEALDEKIDQVAARIPTKTSELENDVPFLTEHQDLSEYAKKEDVQEILESSELVSSVVPTDVSDISESEFAAHLGITTDQLTKLFAGYYRSIRFGDKYEVVLCRYPYDELVKIVTPLSEFTYDSANLTYSYRLLVYRV